MAGMGPPPKPAERRARANKDPIPTKVIPLVTSSQPKLPFEPNPVTAEWWAIWSRSELTQDLTEADWAYLVDTAKIHDAFWRGEMKLAAELRLRVVQFGVTPEARARLRIVFAEADEKSAKATGVTGTRPKTGSYASISAIRPGS